ncbi:MAG: 3-methyl-2-oxobutanoate hydroxymethyltransferase, partial [Candidatus Nanopelagicales bacterium]
REGVLMSLYPAESNLARLTVSDFSKSQQQPWPVLTAYDSWTAKIFDDAGIPMLLVGDSAAMVMLGQSNTLAITPEEMIPMIRAVVRATTRAFVVADLPFGSYQENPDQALATSLQIVKQTGAHAVKLEGGTRMQEQIRHIVESGIPVVGHVGLTPQSVNALGGYKVQGRGDAAEQVMRDAIAVEEAGAFALVVEVVPLELGKRITELLTIPVIGIGAGNQTDAQVLVWQDLFGASNETPAKFVKPYLDLYELMKSGVERWAHDVQQRIYPDEFHSYRDKK